MKNEFTNAMQMKAYIKQKAKLNDIDPRILLQEFVLDDLLERISLSPYRDNLVLKGGFLIASLLGLDTRSTNDLDTTVVGLDVKPEYLLKVFKEICEISPKDDPIKISVIKIELIRLDAQYSGYRIHFMAQIYEQIKPSFKIDLSVGDRITPSAVNYQHRLITENKTITVAAYNLETILAEKLETVLSRGITNTRAKDFYDIYALTKFELQNINFKLFVEAFLNTAENRKTFTRTSQISNEVLCQIIEDEFMISMWTKYQKNNFFAKEVSLKDCCKTAKFLVDKINEFNK